MMSFVQVSGCVAFLLSPAASYITGDCTAVHTPCPPLLCMSVSECVLALPQAPLWGLTAAAAWRPSHGHWRTTVASRCTAHCRTKQNCEAVMVSRERRLDCEGWKCTVSRAHNALHVLNHPVGVRIEPRIVHCVGGARPHALPAGTHTFKSGNKK